MFKDITLKELIKSSISLKKLPKAERLAISAALKTISKEEKEEFYNTLLAEHYELLELQTAAELRIMNKYLKELDELLKSANKEVRLETEINSSAKDLAAQEDLLKKLNSI